MKIQAERNSKENMQTTDVFFIGDVRDVIYSRAEHVIALPSLFNGLGACGTDNPKTVGESVIFRGRAAKTTPDSNAGLEIDYSATTKGFYTPFFVGWNGEPSFAARVVSEEGITVNQLYQDIFSRLEEYESARNFKYVFLEIIGLFRPDDIFDRALQKPVNQGNILTTSAENSANFFKPRIIYNDLSARETPFDELFPLCVVGIGHLLDGSDAEAMSLRESIFYRPPQTATPESEINVRPHEAAKVLTHNHALGWRGDSSFAERLLSSIRSRSEPGDEAQPNDENFVDEVLKRPPDYLVHLDDWSVLRAATVKIYMASGHRFNIQSASGAGR